MLSEITSLKNPRVKAWKDMLKDRSLRQKQGLFPVDGEHMVREALHAGCLEELIVSSDRADRYRDLTLACARSFLVPPHVLDSLSGTVTPQGIMGFCSFPESRPEPVYRGMYVALNAVQDPGNVGTIIRTMDAAGLDTLLIDGRTADPFSPKCVRATMGGIFRIRILRTSSLASSLAELRSRGFCLAAGVLDGSPLPSRPEVRGSVCIMIGNEGQGLDRELSDMADLRVRIPMPGRAESLNASVSAALLIYDFLRERLTNPAPRTSPDGTQ